jgi:hypothetical protein
VKKGEAKCKTTCPRILECVSSRIKEFTSRVIKARHTKTARQRSEPFGRRRKPSTKRKPRGAFASANAKPSAAAAACAYAYSPTRPHAPKSTEAAAATPRLQRPPQARPQARGRSRPPRRRRARRRRQPPARAPGRQRGPATAAAARGAAAAAALVLVAMVVAVAELLERRGACVGAGVRV